MPPVAGEFIRGVAEALAANKEAGRKPDSWRSLCRALAAITDRTADSWADSLKDYRQEDDPIEPREETAALFAKALGVERATLPPVSPRRRGAELDDRLRGIEDRLAKLEANQSAIQRERARGGAAADDALAAIQVQLDQLDARVTALAPPAEESTPESRR